MTKKLYDQFCDLSGPQEQFADELEEAEEPALDALVLAQRNYSLQKMQMIEAIASRVKWWGAQIESVKAKYAPILDAIEAEIRHAEQREKRAKEFLTQLIPAAPDVEVVTDATRIYYKTSTVVDVMSENLVPLEFTRTTTSIDKRAVERELKLNREVPGCKLVNSYSIQISEGGNKGRALAKARQRRLKERTVENENTDGISDSNGVSQISQESKEPQAD